MTDTDVKVASGIVTLIGIIVFCVILLNTTTPENTIFTITLHTLVWAFLWTIIVEIAIVGIVFILAIAISK